MKELGCLNVFLHAVNTDIVEQLIHHLERFRCHIHLFSRHSGRELRCSRGLAYLSLSGELWWPHCGRSHWCWPCAGSILPWGGIHNWGHVLFFEIVTELHRPLSG